MEQFINKIINDDCFNILPKIESSSIDLILIDPPYNILDAGFDKDKIDFNLLFNNLKRIIKNNKCIILTCVQPLTSKIIYNNINYFKHHYIWNKLRGYGFHLIKYKPMMQTEDIIVLCNGKPITYNAQKIKRIKPIKYSFCSSKSIANPCGLLNYTYISNFTYTTNLLSYKKDHICLHPTQKPVALFEHLIKTYSNKNDLVLDCFSGCGTTAIASINTQRNFICIEKDKKYYNESIRRLDDYQQKETKQGIKFRIIGQ